MDHASRAPFIIPSLDGIRALAVTIVIWGHAGLPRLIKESTGVTIFFFLSGYLITTLLRREQARNGRISLRDFYLRRTLRIMPPLYVVTLIAAALSLAGALPGAMTGNGLAACLAFYANYFIILAGRDGLPGGMNALWSLAVEEHYYLLFPLLYIALVTRLRTPARQAGALIALCLAILLWRCVLIFGMDVLQHGGYDRVYLATDTRADAILWGAVFAMAMNPMFGQAPRIRSPRLADALVLASATAFFLLSRLPAPLDMSIGYTLQALTLVVAFVALVQVPHSLSGRVFNLAPLRTLGVLSYGIYLVHRPILILCESLPLHHHVGAAIGLLLSVLAAMLLRATVEAPFEALRARLRHGSAAAPEVLPPVGNAPGT